MKNYNVTTKGVPAVARSKRRREAGMSSSTGAGGVVPAAGGGQEQSVQGDGHTHDNKPALDAISIDDENYLYLKQKVGEEEESVERKVKAGDSDKWGGHEFDEFMDQPVKKASIVEFAKIIISELMTKGAIPGIEIGTGAMIDSQGNAEMQSLILRSFLKVPQLIYNKVSVTGGEMWNTEGGTIASVEQDTETAYLLTMDVEDGDYIELDVDDICKGHYNNSGGFITSYFRVTHVDQASKTVRIVLGADSEVPGHLNAAPVPFMNIARYGNFTNVQRQRSQYFSASEQRIVLLSGVDQYIIRPANYKVVIGDIPSSLVPAYLPIQGQPSIYLDNVLMRHSYELDASDELIKTVRDRGLWSAAVAASQDPYRCTDTIQDDVYHLSCKWRCIVDRTVQEPRFDSTDWLMIAGDTTLSLDIESTEGETFLYGHLNTTLVATVRRGVNDITSTILAADWSWTRDTGDAVADSVWNSDHASCQRQVTLTNEDLNTVSGVFICRAYVRDAAETLRAEVTF